nr:MAG TPA: hypothetical protein [Caudoviricetes sp.]
MKIEDLKKGDIIVPNGATRNNYTQLADRLDFVCVVVKTYVALGSFEVVVIYANDNTWIGERISFSYKDLDCFYRHNLNAIELLKMKRKPLYLRWAFGEKTSLGKVGDKTPYKLENGRNLKVVDIVTIKNGNMTVTGCPVVHDEDDGYYVMGIAALCNSKTGEIKNFTVSFEKSFSDIKNGDTFATACSPAGIEVVYFLPTESEDN